MWRFSIPKISVFQFNYRLKKNKIIKIRVGYFVNWQGISKHIYGEINNSLKKIAVGRALYTWIQTYSKTTVIKVLQYWCKGRHNRSMGKGGMKKARPPMYGQLNFNKTSNVIQKGKNSLFNQWCLNNWTSRWKTMKLSPFLTSCKQ